MTNAAELAPPPEEPAKEQKVGIHEQAYPWTLTNNCFWRKAAITRIGPE